MERLDKRLSQAGFGRKDAQAAIKSGRVTADGVVITDKAAKLPDSAVVAVDGQTLREGQVYLMLHKPTGVVSATRDLREKTVLDLLPPEYQNRDIFPVGRLDKDTTGLLLLTNDGDLAHNLLSPKKHVDKVYEVTVDGTLTEADQLALANRLTLGDVAICLPAKLELTGRPNVGLLTLHEGKYHQVKRMMAALGKPVTALKRLAMGPIKLDEALEPGMWRELTPAEIRTLQGKEPT